MGGLNAGAGDAPARMPDRLREEPPRDRWCDLVLTGGVASGVVYPWAILELARSFRLRNIGGTSVGALAAALAAASEYGRRQGHPHAFEVLRRLPIELAESVQPADGSPPRTRMLSLFQPVAAGQRLFDAVLAVLDVVYRPPEGWAAAQASSAACPAAAAAAQADPSPAPDGEAASASSPAPALGLGAWAWARRWLRPSQGGRLLRAFLGPYRPLLRGPLRAARAVAAVSGLLALGLIGLTGGLLASGWPLLLGAVLVALLLAWAGLRLLHALVGDLRHGLLRNDLGLCRGAHAEGLRHVDAQGRPLPALVEWMHEGIQRAAGLAVNGPPLCFEELWHAPLWPGGPRPGVGVDGQPVERAINLEMVTTNVTHGRPYRLPLNDPAARLFFRLDEWQGIFPQTVLDHLDRVCVPYRPQSRSDPEASAAFAGLLELPAGKLPIVVAARLSLSYPLLFSTVPLYAIDYEQEQPSLRRPMKCRFSDGGLCSNFPVHFFDSALPRWPTFGLWLQRRSPLRPGVPVWLPEHQGQGWGDSWHRFEPDAAAPPGLGTLLGFFWAALLSAKDWRDMSAMRMPHVRRRVARIALCRHEGELNIGMPGSLVMHMAAAYGSAAGRKLCEAYAPAQADGPPTEAWDEHLMVRLQVLLDGLGGLLRHFGAASTAQGHTRAIAELLAEAERRPLIRSRSDQRKLTSAQRKELQALVDQLAALSAALGARQRLPQAQKPAPDLGLRPPL